MKCANCNAELEPGAKFCDNCGAPVLVSPAQETLLSQEPSGFPAAPVAQGISAPPPPQVYPPPSSSADYFSSGPYAPPASQEKIMGMETNTFGIVTLGLGIASLLFSCIGCGGLFSILGIIAGIMSLKTSVRQMGLIGLILSIVGLLISLVVLCIALFAIIGSMGNGGYYY